ncbi:MAG: hypothetical protein M0P71_18575 [Melioribacteraceae bacterium]|jgi:hypothetical protein|nr:hypothetical protein [Melioribacteraceae bacterium]
MAKKSKVKPHKKESFFADIIKSQKEAQAKNLVDDEYFLFSLRQLDSTQGQTFEFWQDNMILADLMNVLQGYCCNKLKSQVDKNKFTIYGDFPRAENTEFNHPKHVPEDARWARIHITGEHILAGHIVGNVFYIVFLDYHHKFWISDKADN